MKEGILAVLLIIAAVVGVILGVWWLIWLLWTWVMPQLWPEGPQSVINPSYWLFAGMWVLICLIGSAFRSSKTSD